MATFLQFVLSFLLLCCMNRVLDGLESKESHQFHTLQVTSLLPSSVCTPSSKGLKGRASLKVVHRHGPCSHLNQDKSNGPPLTQILLHDQSRIDYLRSRISFAVGKKAFQDSKVTLPAKPGLSFKYDGGYLVTVGLGTPKKHLSLVFDTGSDLTWTQCKPCAGSCYAQKEPIFDPSLSTSYSNITCKSTLCSALKIAIGATPYCKGSTCMYSQGYGDNSFSSGYFGREKLTLSSTDALYGYVFGCGQNNIGLFGKTAGLLGLGRSKLSIVSQSAQKYGKHFLYCLPSSSSSTGYLSFGKGKISKSVKYTPFAKSYDASLYYIDILDIYVCGTRLYINPVIFSNVGTIIDSGTTFTYLPSAAYSSLRKTFRKHMARYPKAPAYDTFDTCYDLSNYTTVHIPKISFLFGGHVKVDLANSGILVTQSESQICLAFVGTNNRSNMGIFGSTQQMGLQVIYDVAGGKLGFGSRGCA